MEWLDVEGTDESLKGVPAFQPAGWPLALPAARTPCPNCVGSLGRLLEAEEVEEQALEYIYT